MKDKIFGILQRVGRSFMLPIAILPVAGLFLGFGSSFTNETMLETYHLAGIMGPGTVAYVFFTILNKAGSVIFDNLPLLFAMGVAIGMAKKEKDVAALSAVIAFFIMHSVIGAMIDINGGADAMMSGSTASVLGITSLQMGVFGGIIVGLGVSALHNKFYKIQLPQVLAFFGGTRFVPIISSVVYLLVGIAMFFVWPFVQSGISALGKLVQDSGYAGTWIYGVIERALIPFGLHHVFYLPFWQTNVGGSMEVAGRMVEGAQNIFFAQLADPSVKHFSVSATRFMAGKFPFMIFGLPGAALAMYHTAKTKKKKVVGGLLLSAALTAMITGITEPIEFTFLFVAPLLYVIHCILAGLSYMLMHILNVGVGMTFSGGLIDMVLFGVMQGGAKTSWYWIPIVGAGYFVVYYFLFKTLILKMNLNTPGRESDSQEPKLFTRADVNARKASGAIIDSLDDKDLKSAMIVYGLGGADNISDVDCCATRLRTTVLNGDLVKEDYLKQSGAAGVIRKGNGVQVIYGPSVTVVKSNLEDFLGTTTAANVNDIFSNGADLAKNIDVNENDAAAKEALKADEKANGKVIEIYAPENGKVIAMKDVPDDAFAQEILGKGVAIEPIEGKLFAPVDGTVSVVFDTKHAIGLLTADGTEVFMHIGIDTVKLDGKFFNYLVKENDEVKKGDALIEFDMEQIKAVGYPVITPVIITNPDDYDTIEVKAEIGKAVKAGDNLLNLK